MFHDRFLDLFTNLWKEVIILGLTIVLIAFAYLKYKFLYWKRRGIPYVEPSYPCGSLTDLVFARKSINQIILDIYKKAEGHKYIGFYSFWTPTLFIRDVELIKNVLIKDFDVFYNRGVFSNKDDPLANHLFSLNGNKWKNTRSKLSPNFSTGKVKQMYVVMKACAMQLNDYLKEELLNKKEGIDFKDLIARHSLNVIANTAVGIEGHSLKEESSFSKIALKATEPSLIQAFRFVISMLSKDTASLFQLRFTPKDVEHCYLNMTKTIVEHRSKEVDNTRNDFMQLLIELWNKDMSLESRPESDDDTMLSLNDLAAQTYLFVMAAYESTTSVVCFTLYEIAKNPEIQQRLISEIDSAGPVENLTYDKLVELKYLDMVMNEVWRLYPPLGLLQRECQKDYKLPDGKVLEKGTIVIVPPIGLQMNPEYFPDPEKFDPERFNKEAPSHVIQPYTYMPFGEGPRFCIGKRYGVINTKITLFSLLSKYRFELTEKSSGPLIIDPKVFVTQRQGGMHLKAIARK